MKYDLLEDNGTAGPSRKTRRARNERMQALQTTSASAPPIPSTKYAAEDKIVWKLLDEVKSKSKGKGRAVDGPAPESISATPSNSHKGKARVGALEGRSESISSASVVRTPVSAHSRRRPAMGPPPDPPLPHKKRKLQRALGSAGLELQDPIAPLPQISNRLRSSRALLRSEKSLAESIVDIPPDEPSSPVKRIKLIVRRPIPTLTNPLQRLPTPKHGSVTAFLESYSAPRGVDLDQNGLRKLYQEDLEVWRKIDSLRRQGRMLYRPPDDDGSGEQWPETRRQPDVWDAIMEAVKIRAETPLPYGPDVAAQVASQVKAYWNIRAVRDDKAKAQEERRLKALAKATIRMVTAEWKKVVFVSGPNNCDQNHYQS